MLKNCVFKGTEQRVKKVPLQYKTQEPGLRQPLSSFACLSRRNNMKPDKVFPLLRVRKGQFYILQRVWGINRHFMDRVDQIDLMDSNA